MGLFNKHEEPIRGSMARMKQEPKPTQEIVMVIEYFDKTIENISVTYNLEDLQKLVSSSFGTGASMNFSEANPPFSINPRWVKKINFKARSDN
ncbi:thiopurine S-methyltransferase [Streptococcus mutans]|uniref:thiopurine S-methyltransferase n=1 Tax=Streptococcus mutans TaxID=1309 RepID=UPI0022836C13|nr:thiopurine S-methyltransferase [Streptococcus mutans]MCY7116771.1 thiopurine S-methyltransferase [Streptococcus mutans]